MILPIMIRRTDYQFKNQMAIKNIVFITMSLHLTVVYQDVIKYAHHSNRCEPNEKDTQSQ